MDDEDKNGVALFLLFIFVVCIIVEVSILGYAYFHADTVKCNWGWCEFTTTRKQSVSSQDCFVNGEKVNCSDFKDRYSDIYYHGEREISGICPSWNDNRSISDCINEAKGVEYYDK